jgi:hypothetical protein
VLVEILWFQPSLLSESRGAGKGGGRRLHGSIAAGLRAFMALAWAGPQGADAGHPATRQRRRGACARPALNVRIPDSGKKGFI